MTEQLLEHEGRQREEQNADSTVQLFCMNAALLHMQIQDVQDVLYHDTSLPYYADYL